MHIEVNNLKAALYLSIGADVLLTLNLWTEVGLDNHTKGTVLYFLYTYSEGPRNGGVPKAVAVQLWYLAKSTHIEPFLEVYEQSVEIPIKRLIGNMMP